MNPFGFLLRWLDRRIVRVAAAERVEFSREIARRAAADAIALDLRRG
jgi:hypothetical protein